RPRPCRSSSCLGAFARDYTACHIPIAIRRSNMILSNTLHKTLRTLGFDYSRYSPNQHPLALRRKQLQSFAIDLVLDVGANRGQTGTLLRAAGYTGEIISFEPLRGAFDVLAKTA